MRTNVACAKQSNFSSTPIPLRRLQGIAKAAARLSNPVESHITHGYVLGLIPDEPSKGYCSKRNTDPQNIDTINQHLVDQHELHISVDEKPKTADEIKIHVLKAKEQAVREMLL